MATKGKARGGKGKLALAKTIKAGDTMAALMAISTQATDADSLHSAIFQCIAAAFAQEGLHNIGSETAKIVWSDIPDDLIVKLGNDVTDCLAAKGIHVPDLSTSFDALKTSNQVTVVSDLIDVVAGLAG
jgi:hypothetical protein